MTTEETPKRRPGRPSTGKPQKTSASYRIEREVLDDVQAIAKELGETASEVAERGLLEYRARHRDLLDKLRDRKPDVDRSHD